MSRSRCTSATLLPFSFVLSLLGWVLHALSLTTPAAAQEGEAQEDANVAQARTHFEEGEHAYAEGRFNEAAEHLVAAYQLTASPELAFNVGRVYERMSNYDGAIRFFRIYLRRGSPSAAERADVEERVERLKEAKQRRHQQVFTAPPSTDDLTQEARAFFLRGVAMFHRHEYQAAMQAFIAAQRYAPLPEVLYNMAVTAERLEQSRDAADYYREYLRLRPEAPDRGEVERRMQRLRGH